MSGTKIADFMDYVYNRNISILTFIGEDEFS